jgi:kynurenine formamidase
VTRLVDLSMPVHRDMLTFPRVPPPTLLLYESWAEFAERIGAAQYGATSLTASYLVIQNDHVGSHCDAVKHIRGPDAPGVEGIPLEYCFSDGVVLDFREKEYGSGISAA